MPPLKSLIVFAGKDIDSEKYPNLNFIRELSETAIGEAMGEAASTNLAIRILSKDSSFLTADLIAQLKGLETSGTFNVQMFLMVTLQSSVVAVSVKSEDLSKMIDLELKINKLIASQA